eukprot:TRINITY_DN8432_c0_g1_i1.p1 TRINITY_DN8432_c0_g1~~TRINITY_DN8432_c0_g1_i1.p1  ORF type:complete len:91 (-),score=6.84 TRINITY_DN8432_c0_g1_i1:34-306(-)
MIHQWAVRCAFLSILTGNTFPFWLANVGNYSFPCEAPCFWLIASEQHATEKNTQPCATPCASESALSSLPPVTPTGHSRAEPVTEEQGGW